MADLTEPGAAEHLVEETRRAYGGLDAVGCNAGGPPAGNFAAFPDDAPWRRAIELNLMTTLRLSRTALPPLVARGGGSITNIVSISAKQPIPHLILSNTARTAVIGMAKTMATEF